MMPANPLTYINASAAPFLLFHGSQDGLISPSQTLLLHNALNSAGAHSTTTARDMYWMDPAMAIWHSSGTPKPACRGRRMKSWG
jgi:hypothetical protein